MLSNILAETQYSKAVEHKEVPPPPLFSGCYKRSSISSRLLKRYTRRDSLAVLVKKLAVERRAPDISIFNATNGRSVFALWANEATECAGEANSWSDSRRRLFVRRSGVGGVAPRAAPAG